MSVHERHIIFVVYIICLSCTLSYTYIIDIKSRFLQIFISAFWFKCVQLNTKLYYKIKKFNSIQYNIVVFCFRYICFRYMKYSK